ncbi:MAG: ABC transporter ATP-binding protein [Planctomycetota bacterium]|jgi:ABC-2 type transport system ATP-binding protein
MSDAIPLEVNDLSMRYRRGLLRRGHQALHDVSLRVERGQVFGLLGPNGAGKTTLVKILLGLAVGWKGDARLFGERAGKAASRRRVGYLPESHRLPNYLTGRQVLQMFGMMCGRDRAWVRERIDGWLERVDMARDGDRKLREYSKGMTQRVGLAAALIHEPEIVFLDEPTDGVDPVGRAAIRDVIEDLKRSGTTVFLNSHLLLEVERMCDRVVIMDRGRLIKQGTLEELTPTTGAVRIELGAPADVSGILPEQARLMRAEGRDLEISGDQDVLDATIDALRRAGHSIRAIDPRRMDLEEAFIDLVGKERKS